jgi:hypothetical protein
MRSLILLFLMSLTTGCGGTYEVKGIPSEIKHTVNINLDQLLNYCSNKCGNQYQYYPEYIQSCTDDCVNNFVEMLTNLGVPNAS